MVRTPNNGTVGTADLGLRQPCCRSPRRQASCQARALLTLLALLLCVPAIVPAADQHPGEFFLLTREGNGGTLGPSDGSSARPLPALHHQGRADATRWTTDASTRLVIALSNGIILAQDYNSSVTLERFTQAPFDAGAAANSPDLEPSRSVLKLHLDAGTIALRTGKLRDNSNTSINFGPSTLQIGGGLFWIQKENANNFEIRIYSGRARLERPDAETLFIAAGNQLRMIDGEPQRESLQDLQLDPREEAFLRGAERGFRRIRILASDEEAAVEGRSPRPTIRLIYPPRTPRS